MVHERMIKHREIQVKGGVSKETADFPLRFLKTTADVTHFEDALKIVPASSRSTNAAWSLNILRIPWYIVLYIYTCLLFLFSLWSSLVFSCIDNTCIVDRKNTWWFRHDWTTTMISCFVFSTNPCQVICFPVTFLLWCALFVHVRWLLPPTTTGSQRLTNTNNTSARNEVILTADSGSCCYYRFCTFRWGM